MFGFSEIFGKKKKPEDISLEDFSFHYLYGFTDNPNQNTQENTSFLELYRLVVGNVGGVVINSSFHPYNLVNQKGTVPWHVAYVKIYTSENRLEIFNTIVNENAVYVSAFNDSFYQVQIWPDQRLAEDGNAIFQKFIPFVIPFLVYRRGNLIWDKVIKDEVKKNGHAGNYLSQVNNAVRFFMKEPTFVVGLDEFDDKAPSKLIDNFMNMKAMFEGGKT